jgi:hypothetical protein
MIAARIAADAAVHLMASARQAVRSMQIPSRWL